MEYVKGLIQGRHEIPDVSEYIFENALDPADIQGIRSLAEKSLDFLAKEDSLTVYVTGLTVALVEVINICHEKGVRLTLMHFDRETSTYFPQEIL
jgi:hypothetical protein